MPDFPSIFKLAGRTAIVSGGAGLLGAEFCRTLAEAGAAVLVADIDDRAAVQVATKLIESGYQAVGCKLDVRSPKSIRQVVETAICTFNQVDILVNSAAIDPKFDRKSRQPHSGAFEDYPLDLWEEALTVNLTGAMLCCQAVSKPMLSAGRGVMINIASMYGIVAPDQGLYQEKGKSPRYKPAAYSATKAGLLGLTRYLAAYFAGKNIRVNALSPGGVFNDHAEGFLTRYATRAVMGRMAEKDELNGALLFLASDASSYMTGANLVVDGGWTSW